jgi:hypothetical protein
MNYEYLKRLSPTQESTKSDLLIIILESDEYKNIKLIIYKIDETSNFVSRKNLIELYNIFNKYNLLNKNSLDNCAILEENIVFNNRILKLINLSKLISFIQIIQQDIIKYDNIIHIFNNITNAKSGKSHIIYQKIKYVKDNIINELKKVKNELKELNQIKSDIKDIRSIINYINIKINNIESNNKTSEQFDKTEPVIYKMYYPTLN